MGLSGRRREAAARGAAGLQRDQRSRHGARRWTRRRPPAPATGPQAARQAGQRRAGEHDDVGAVLVDARSASAIRAVRPARPARCRCRPAAVQARMLASRPSEAVGLHHLAVPGLDALRDRDDREALAQQVGAGQRRLGQAGHRARAAPRAAPPGRGRRRRRPPPRRSAHGARRPAAPSRRRRSAPRSASRCRPRRRARSAPRSRCPATRCAAPRRGSARRRCPRCWG